MIRVLISDDFPFSSNMNLMNL